MIRTVPVCDEKAVRVSGGVPARVSWQWCNQAPRGPATRMFSLELHRVLDPFSCTLCRDVSLPQQQLR